MLQSSLMLQDRRKSGLFALVLLIAFFCLAENGRAYRNFIILNDDIVAVGERITLGSGVTAGRVTLVLKEVHDDGTIVFEVEEMEVSPGRFVRSNRTWVVKNENCFPVPGFNTTAFYCFRNRVNSPYEYTFFMRSR